MKHAICLAATLSMIFMSTGTALSQDIHQRHHQADAQVHFPLEQGQAGFAAIAEIVTMLSNDPNTQWDKVNIDALREHLVDMDELILRATVKTTEGNGAIIFEVTGTGRTLDAIRAMVPAHAQVLASDTKWLVSSEPVESGTRLKISATDPRQLEIVRGLGFFGIMATGAHHQEHHLAIARGGTMH